VALVVASLWVSLASVSLVAVAFPMLNKAVAFQIKGPDNPTSQLLPIMSFSGFSGDREGRKDKGGGERSRR